ncbi:hypothetical protein PENTCL1PPCAC_3816, partial [Pristionchus entomophagus]
GCARMIDYLLSMFSPADSPRDLPQQPAMKAMEIERRLRPEVEEITNMEGVRIIKPKVFPDARGFFSESYNAVEWKEQLGFDQTLVQDNHSFSHPGVLRGLHAQPGMGKLVTVAVGRIFDVIVDARPGSATFGKWKGVYLDAGNRHALWVPDGFLHGFQVVSEEGAHVMYKCSAVYDATTEYGIDPFDADLAIDWPQSDAARCIVSERDRSHPAFATLRRS